MNGKVMKRALSLLLMLAMLMGNVPTAVFAADGETSAPIEAVVEETAAATEPVVVEETVAATEPAAVDETSAPPMAATEETEPVTEDAQETVDTAQTEEEPAAESASNEIASGKCGENVIWVLTDDGVLTISGTGAMAVYGISNAPWYNYRSQIQSIVINEGVTSIGDGAFYDCESLTSIAIPASVTSIGACAFSWCLYLTGIAIPASVTSIDDYAFEWCVSLTSITIPDSVISIGEGAFGWCSGLTGITIPNSVTRIGYQTFYCCSSLTSITIPDSVISIGDAAFGDCSSLTNITIPDGVTSIGDSAFYRCSSLTGITIPDSMTSIGDAAFCGCSNLTNITIPDSVTSIGSWMFDGCSSLTSITIPDGVTSIGDWAFGDCSSLTNITIPDGVTSIGDSAFYRCSSLTGITIPEGVTSIGNSAFYHCDSLPSITIPESVTSIGNSAFEFCESLTSITIPDSVINIGDNAFTYCFNLKSITIPEGVTSIGGGAFECCYCLLSITIPEGVTSIGDYAFSNCSSLTSITLPEGVTSIGNSAFEYCTSLKSITIPNGITSISEGTFALCSSLSGITIPDSVTSIGERAFDSCASLTNITIPDSVTSIGAFAFRECLRLTSVVIPDSVTSIGNYAFYYCSSLTSITLPDSVISIGEAAFYNCESLTSITLPDSVTSIDSSAFAFCSSLSSITIPEGVTSIGEWAFSACWSLTSIAIPESVTSIGDGAFSDCESLVEITFKGNAPAIGERAFSGVTATAYYPAGNATWTESVMQNYGGTITWKAAAEDAPGSIIASGKCGENVTWVLTDDGVLTISGTGAMEDYRFKPRAPWYNYRSQIQSIVINEGVTSIGDGAFGGCDSLTSITLPESVTSIGDYAFYGCDSLKGIWVSEANPNYSSDEFGVLFNKKKSTLIQCPGGMVGTYRIPDSVTSIGNSAFNYCRSLSSINIPDSVTSIGNSAFEYCESLTSITIPESVTSIGNYAFSYCNSLLSITIPEGVTSIGSWTFEECDSLTSITIPESVTSIGDAAFGYCDSLIEITFKGNAPAIGEDAFLGVTATAYYPAGNATWTESVMQNYGGSLTWVAVAHEHEWGEWVVTKEPTCTEKGEETRTCSVCGESETREVAALGHRFGEWVVTTEPTCTEKGEETRTCSVCGETETRTVDALGHDYQNGYCVHCGKVESIASGKCGESLTWELTGDGKLTISGTGAMADYGYGETPWYDYRGDITSAVVETGVTSIGSWAFVQCENVTQITIPDGVTSVGAGAFRECLRLTSVVIPDSVSSIGNYAFHDCGSLTSVVIPTGVTTVGYSTFAYCYNLKSVTIPETVTGIGDYAFFYCESLTDVTIPSGVTGIGESAFQWCGLSEIVIPANVVSIDDYAFYGCSGLKKITFMGNAPTIGEDAFGDVTATVSYPVGDATWTSDVMQNYGGNLTWVVAAHEHEWGEWVVTKAPTYTEKGEETRTCSICGETETREIAALGLPTPAVQVTADVVTGGATLSWEHDGEADFYEIHYATSKTGKYKLLDTADDAQFQVTPPVGKTYYYKVKAVCEADASLSSSFSAAVKATGKCAQPELTVEVNEGSGKPVLSWGKISGAKKYEVYRATAEDGTYKKIKTTTSRTYTDTSAAVGTTYYYKVKAVASSSTYNSVFSEIKFCQAICARPVVTVSVAAATGKPILSWKAVTGAVGYEISRSENGSDFYVVATQTALTYTDESAAPDTDYWYAVKAIGSEPELSSTNSTAVKIHSTLAKPVVAFAVDAVSGKPVLTWEEVDGAKEYIVYRSTSATKSYKAVTTTTELAFTDTTVSVGKGYYYKVIAIGENAKSAYSSYKKLSGKCAQPELNVEVNTASGKPMLTWGKISGAKKYEVYRAADENGTYKKVKTVTTASYTDTSAVVGTPYFYKIRAVASSSSYNSIFSEIKFCQAVCARPVVTVSVAAATGKPVISWKAVTGAASYEIYRSENDGEMELVTTQTELTYTDEEAIVDSQYSYVVKALAENHALDSAESVTVSITAACAKPVATIALNGKKPMISWEPVAGAVKYEVYRSTKAGSGYKKVATVEEGESYTDLTAKKGTTYYYKVVAVSESTSSAFSNYVKIKSK